MNNQFIISKRTCPICNLFVKNDGGSSVLFSYAGPNISFGEACNEEEEHSPSWITTIKFAHLHCFSEASSDFWKNLNTLESKYSFCEICEKEVDGRGGYSMFPNIAVSFRGKAFWYFHSSCFMSCADEDFFNSIAKEDISS